MRARLVLRAGTAALVALTAGCGGHAATGTGSTGHAPAARQGPPRLSFAPGAGPLGYRDRGVALRHGRVAVHDVSYLGPGGRIAGFLAEPGGAARRPGIVLVHGAGGDRSELLADGIALAQRGAVALTITEPSTAHPLPAPQSNAELLTEARQVTVEDVVAVRRAADVLARLPSVDGSRLGYLGWSNGAKTGAFVAAADPRFQALALLSAGADPVSAFVRQAPAALRSRARSVLGSVDPLRYIAAARRGTVLLEDGSRDSIVPHRALLNFVHAAPPGTTVHWYPADHQLDEQAYDAAFRWLLAKLR